MKTPTHTVYLSEPQARGVAAELMRVGVPFCYQLRAEGFRIQRHTLTVDDSRSQLVDRIVAIVKLRQSR